MPSTERLRADQAGLGRAAALLRAGGTVAFPTETVYGLGADATNGRAVAAVYEAKGRPRFNPLIVHLPCPAEAEPYADMPAALARLGEAFWPGPLTLVAPLREGSGLSDLVTAGVASVALRVPAHPLAQALLAEAGTPLAAPSANPSGSVSPTTADHVLDGLAGQIAAVLDGGACAVGLESTIVGLDAEGRPVLLRPGGVPVEAIEAVLGERLGLPGDVPGDGPVTAPGQLASHYAPRARLRLSAEGPREGEAWLGFGPDRVTRVPARSLSSTGDLGEAAANLFAHLRALDAAMPEGGTIAVAPVPETGLGRAINDRLRRAAAPRE